MNVKHLYVIACLIFSPMISAQSVDPVSEVVNEQVWQAFKTAYEARDSEAFKAIHTDDVLRVNDSGIKTANMYFASIDNWREPNDGRKIMIDFAFENRQYLQNIGYETGYYRVVITRGESQGDVYYGMFHVVLRKENGVWKIAQDFDTESVGGHEVDRSFFEEANFLKLN